MIEIEKRKKNQKSSKIEVERGIVKERLNINHYLVNNFLRIRKYCFGRQ